MDLDPVFLSRLQFAFVVSFPVIVLPVIAAYTVHVYWVFRGKVHAGYG